MNLTHLPPWLDAFAYRFLQIAGPIEPPTRLKRTVIPRDIPLNCLGVVSKTILKPPTWVRDKPAAIIARLADTKNSVEWKINRLKRPIILIALPRIVGLIFPSLEIINPDDGANNKKTTINGS